MRSLLSFKLAYRHVRATLGRMALSVAALTLGVALVVAIQLMNTSVLDAFLDAVDNMAGGAAVSITAGDGVPFDERVAEQAAVDGVVKIVPVVTGVAFPDDDSGELLMVHAMDLTDHEAVEVYHRGDTRKIVSDAASFFLKRDSIVLPREYAERRGLEVGSPFTLVTPKGVQAFTVRGLLDPQGLAQTLGGRLVVMDLYAAEEAFTSTGQITRIDIVVRPGREEAVVEAVASRLPAGLRVEETAVRREVTRKAFRALHTMLTAFGLLVVVVGFVICYSRLGVIFEARTWEVGLVRAVGLTRSAVFLELLKESLVLGALGTAIGIPLGVAIGRFALPIVATATALQYHLPLPAAEPTLPLRAIVVGVVVGLSAAALAAAAPALRLARKQPVAALTMRGREVRSVAAPVRWAILSGLLVLLLVLVAWQRVFGGAALGHVTTAMVAVVACVGARPLVQHGGGLLGRVWQRLFGALGLLAARRLDEHARRASLTVATLGLGLGVVLMFAILVRSFEHSLTAQVTARLRADLVVTSPFVSGGWMNAPLSEDVSRRIGDLPGVAAVAAEQRKDVILKGREVVLDGYDSACFENAHLCEWPLENGALPDAMAMVASGEAVLVASPLARLLGVRPGDILDVPSPHGPQRLRISGVTIAEPEPAIIMSRTRYRATWNDRLVTWIHVAAGDRTHAEEVRKLIEQRLGEDHRLFVRTGEALIAFFGDQVRLGFRFLYPMEAITLLLVLIGIGDTLATSVLERTRELAMMRAVGLQRSRVFAMMMLEGCTIGILGLVLAVAVGGTLGVFWVEEQLPALLGWVLDLYVPYAPVIAGGVLGLALCLVGSLLPSARAAYISVPVALRNE